MTTAQTTALWHQDDPDDERLAAWHRYWLRTCATPVEEPLPAKRNLRLVK